MEEIKGLGLRWLCPECGRVVDKASVKVKDLTTNTYRRYHSSYCRLPLIRCTVTI